MSAARRLARRGFVLGAVVTLATASLVPRALATPQASATATAGMSAQRVSSPGHSPVPTYSSVNAVSCPRPSQCLLVGTYTVNDVASVLTERQDGTAWSVLPSSAPPAATSSVLNAISCASLSYCVAAGSYTDATGANWALTELWNGRSWAVLDTPPPAHGAYAALNGVDCVDASFCVAVGSYVNSRSVPVTLVESWNGSAWTILDSPNADGTTSNILSAVSCTSATYCSAAGSDTDATYVAHPLVESWDGSSWSIIATREPSGAQGTLLKGISCSDADQCVAVGSYSNRNFIDKTLAETWNGARWSLAASATPAGSPSSVLYAVSCHAEGCLAVGHSYSGSAAAKDDALAETWNGSSWTIVATPSPSTTAALRGVSCAGAANCLAAGLFFTSSANYQTLAETWNGSVMTIANQNAPLKGVSCVTASWCMSVGSYVSKHSVSTTLAEVWTGAQWTVLRTPAPADSQSSYLEAVSCLSIHECVAVGYYFAADNTRDTLVESWNGVRWSIVASPNVDGAAYSVLYAVSCSDATHCMAVGSAAARTLAESWDGAAWTIASTSDRSSTAYSELSSVDCSSSVRCLAVGYETDTDYHADLTLAERWDGSSWQLVPSAAPGKSDFLSSVLRSMSCSHATCFAVGYSGRRSGKFGVLIEQWTGDAWVVVPSPTPARSRYSDLGAISCAAGRCLAVGAVLTSTASFVPWSERWNGTEWDVVPVPAAATTPSGIAYLQGISCTTPSQCLAVGTTGNPATMQPLGGRWDGATWSIAPVRGW